MTNKAPTAAETLPSSARAFICDINDQLGARRLGLCVALVLLCTVAESASLMALLPVLQTLNGQPPHPGLAWLSAHGLPWSLGSVLVVFMVLVLTRAWLVRLRDIRLLALRLDYVDGLRRRIELSLAGAHWRYLSGLRHAEVMHVLYDHLTRVSQGTHHLLQLLAGLGLGLASLMAVAWVAPVWNLLLLLPLAGLAWLLRGQLSHAGRLGARLSQGQLELLTSSRDLLGGLKLVKAHGLETAHVTRLQTHADTLRRDLMGFARSQSRTRSWFELGAALVLSTFVYISSRWGGIDLPTLILSVLACSRLMPILRDGQLQLQQLLHSLPAFQATQNWMARNLAASEPLPHRPQPRLPLRQSLVLDNVGFRYQPDGPATLQPLRLELPAGSCTALTGPSGSGKTTLADLILGLLQPSEGRILVDNAPLTSPELSARWRQSVAYVSQDTYLFPASLRDNLCWLAGPQSDATLWEALSQADAAAFVTELPGRLDHMLGERGEGLSGGQRQRLALARALLCRPELLVLDEVSSHLDADSEARVNAAISGLRGRTTILLIAHRPSALAPAERVLVIEAGRLVSDSRGL